MGSVKRKASGIVVETGLICPNQTKVYLFNVLKFVRGSLSTDLTISIRMCVNEYARWCIHIGWNRDMD